jgi:hypothetical protein
VWLETGHGRAFYPYRNALAIYERPAADVDGGATDAGED